MASTADPPTADPLRVVLFGMPAAGKSSLLGALAQAAGTQERALEARVADLPPGLVELRRRVYEGDPRATEAEVTAYPVTVEPLVGGKPDPAGRARVELVDCDGRVAGGLMSRRLTVAQAAAESELARTVLAADTLVLVIDAAAPPEQTDADLAEFVRFMALLEEHRGANAEVADLPVWLVLTKCDLLARPGDTAAQWRGRIDEAVRATAARFRAALEAEEDAPAFGTIDLHTAATAVRRPALAGGPAQPREPFGVAELFRGCFDSAWDYHARLRASRRRLGWTVVATASLVAGMLAAGLGLVATRDLLRRSPLFARVESYQAREGTTAAARLRGPLDVKLAELADIKADPDFARLGEGTRYYVNERAAELEAYLDWQRKLAAERPPAELRSAEDLNALEARLKGPLAPPKAFAEEWRRTEATRVREQWLADADALREAVALVTDWYGKLKAEGDRLLLFGDPTGKPAPKAWVDWRDEVARLGAKAANPPFDLTRPLPGPRAYAAVPPPDYAAAADFPVARRAAEDWERTRQRLGRLADVAAALGLAGEDDAPLRVPAMFKAADAAGRLAALRKAYPDAGDWSLRGLPEGAAPDVRASAERSLEHLRAAGQDAVLALLRQACPDGGDTPACWSAVAARLPAAEALRGFPELWAVLARLAGRPDDDPVARLAAFLRTPAFELTLDRLTLTADFDLRDRVRPDGPLTVYHQPASASAPASVALALQTPAGSPDPRARTVAYEFAATPAGRVTFRPGDTLWAELPMAGRDGARWQLTWFDSRSAAYQHERLARPPRLHKPGAPASRGESAAASVRVGWAVPDLLPQVR